MPQGPYSEVFSGTVGSSADGAAPGWHAFVWERPVSARYWRFVAVDNHGWTVATTVTDVQLKGLAVATCGECAHVCVFVNALASAAVT